MGRFPAEVVGLAAGGADRIQVRDANQSDVARLLEPDAPTRRQPREVPPGDPRPEPKGRLAESDSLLLHRCLQVAGCRSHLEPSPGQTLQRTFQARKCENPSICWGSRGPEKAGGKTTRVCRVAFC